MTTVQTLHPVPAPTDTTKDIDHPTTPRLHSMTSAAMQSISRQKEEDTGRTPTNVSFAEANGKRALPLSPPPPTHASLAKHVVSDAASEDGKRPVSQRSNRSLDSNEVLGTEHSHTSPENDEGSDTESVDGDTGRPTKKKKGQRFFCTDYPPCNLSFTRSEHLARHIRKHTGERPFQCHCNRRFSRLDNLRQHAQTVHVNEEIPTDSLAATGTRFQRQIRTDRVRPAGARARASTTSSATSHGRGHSRNLSTSSITSIASIASTASNVSTISSISQDHRFHPLMMAPEQRPPASLTIDTHRASNQFNYTAPSASGGPTTPTSTNYTNNPTSPYSTITSPVASTRYPSYEGGSRHGRRLSVPNATPPYHAGYVQTPLSPSSSHSFVVSNGNSTIASPTTSVFTNRQELTPSEAELRRRTWHPSTYPGYSYQRPATSGLSYSQTPDAPQPAFAPQAVAAASQPVTLPGFRDLVNTINRPATPPNQTSGQQPLRESPNRPPLLNTSSSSDRSTSSAVEQRPTHRSWDVSLHQNLNKLDLASGTPPREVGWGQQTISDINHAAASVRAPPAHLQNPAVQAPNAGPAHPPGQQQQQPPLLGPAIQTNHAQGPQPMEVEPSSPTHGRRQGWYQGPIAPASQVNMAPHQRISPASSVSEGVPTPSNPSFEHHPTIVHANGYVEAPRAPHHVHATQPSVYAAAAPPQNVKDQPQLSGLDALVAVATSASQSREGRH